MSASASDALTLLRQQFAQLLPVRLEAIRNQFFRIDHCVWQPAEARNLHQLVHSLTTASGTFGMNSVSIAARALETRLAGMLAAELPPAAMQWSAVAADLERLEKLARMQMLQTASAPVHGVDSPSAEKAPLIAIIEVDDEYARHLCAALTRHGYRVSVYDAWGAFQAGRGAGEIPAALVVEMALLQGEDIETAAFKSEEYAAMPVIFTSAEDHLIARLYAYRAGASRYLAKPVDVAQLAGLLDELTGRMPARPYRVLLVDDDAELLEDQARVLRQAGLVVHAMTDPLQILEALRVFDPDVLLLDVDMPAASGPELSAVLREHDAYAHLPILFLAAKTANERRATAFNIGGDELMFKPVDPAYLIAAISARANRARRHGMVMARLKHTLYEREREHLTLDQHAIVSVADAAGRITYANGKFCEVSGYTQEELLGQNHRIVKSDRHSAEIFRKMWQTIAAGRIWQGELCNRRKDGSLYWVESTITPFLDARGKPYQYVSIRTDVTALKLSQQALKVSDERLRRGQIYANIGTWDWNIESGELYWSERIAPLFGYAQGALATTYKNFLNAVHPDDRQAVIDALTACVEKDVPYEIEHRVVWPDGSVHWLLERGAVVRNAAGKPLRMLGVVQDIHARKMAEEEARELTERLEKVTSRIPGMVYQFKLHPNGRRCFPYASEGIRDILRLSPEEVRKDAGKAFALIHPDDIEGLIEAGEVSARTLQPWRHEARVCFPDGTVRWLHGNSLPEPEADGSVVWYGYISDVTESKMAEIALRDSEQRWSFAVEGAGDGVWDWKMPSNEMLFSKFYKAMLGYDENEMRNHADEWSSRVHPDDWARVQRNLNDYLQGKIPSYAIELRLRHKHGGYKWILCRATVVERDASGNPLRMIGIHSDITERKKTEAALQNSEARLSRILASAHDAIIMIDALGNVSLWNPMAERILGYRAEEVMGRFLHHIIVPQRFFPAFASAFAAFQESGKGAVIGRVVELVALHKEGHEVPVEITLSAINMEGKWHAVGMLRDITLRKQNEAELLAAKEAAERASKAKSDFLSSMSHELRTPMNAILGFGQLLEYDESLNEEQLDSVHEIIKAGHHLLQLINEVLDLAKIESGHIELSLEAVGLHELIEDCLHLIRPLAAERDITVHYQDAAGAWVRADRVRLRQVLLNLLSNAVKYNRAGGEVRLIVEASIHGNFRVAVSDTGPGISPERTEELFQPFNRLDAESSDIEGTGIGLTITRKLIKMMGGDIGVNSVIGAGSTFWIELSQETMAGTTDAGIAANRHAVAAAAAQRTQRVLYIEDNPANLKLVVHILAHRPHIDLLTAHTPELGIELALAHQPELILLDINMPGIDGYRILEIFQADARLKNVPVVAVTANAMPRDIERGMQAGFAAYLAKPLDVEDFLNVVDSKLPSLSCHPAREVKA